MINACELRIGNYINDMAGGMCEVRGVGVKGVWIRDSAGIAPENAFSPIPLTEELVRKINLPDKWYIGGLMLDIEYDVEDHILVIYTDPSNNYSDSLKIPCEYLHQLQNLCFDLTGEELTIINTI